MRITAAKKQGLGWRRGEEMTSRSTEFRKKVVSLLAFILLPLYMPYTLIAWFIVAIGGVFALVRWLAHNTVYVCPNCGYGFRI